MKRPNPLPPSNMSPTQRRNELCAVLGLGLALVELDHLDRVEAQKVDRLGEITVGLDPGFASFEDEANEPL